MSSGADPRRIDFFDAREHVDRPHRVVEHLGHAARRGMASLVLGHAGGEVGRQRAVPQEAARAKHRHAALGQPQPPGELRRPFQSGSLANGVVDRRMKHDHAGQPPAHVRGHEQIGVDPRLRLGLVGDQPAGDLGKPIRLDDLVGRGSVGPRPDAQRLEPGLAQLVGPRLPGRHRRNAAAVGIGQQRLQARRVGRQIRRRRLHFSQPRYVLRGWQAHGVYS